MPSTARTVPASVKKWTRRSSTSSNAGGRAASLLEAWIEGIRESVGQEIEAKHGHENGRARRERGPRRDFQGFVVEVQQLAPADRLGVTEPEEAHHRFGEDRALRSRARWSVIVTLTPMMTG